MINIIMNKREGINYEQYLEANNLGFSNIGELKAIKDNKDISKKCSVIFKLSKNAMLGLGTEMIRLAHNFNYFSKCDINPIKENSINGNLGIILKDSSSKLERVNKVFQDIFSYDPNWGNY